VPIASGVESCPALIAAATTSIEYTEHGGALIFVATSDVTAVRHSAHRLIDVHNAHLLENPNLTESQKLEAMQQLMDPRSGAAADSPSHADLMRIPAALVTPSTAAFDEIATGARVTFSVLDPKDRDTLRAELRRHACKKPQP
jgi:hypothetical protein